MCSVAGWPHSPAWTGSGRRPTGTVWSWARTNSQLPPGSGSVGVIEAEEQHLGDCLPGCELRRGQPQGTAVPCASRAVSWSATGRQWLSPSAQNGLHHVRVLHPLSCSCSTEKMSANQSEFSGCHQECLAGVLSLWEGQMAGASSALSRSSFVGTFQQPLVPFEAICTQSQAPHSCVAGEWDSKHKLKLREIRNGYKECSSLLGQLSNGASWLSSSLEAVKTCLKSHEQPDPSRTIGYMQTSPCPSSQNYSVTLWEYSVMEVTVEAVSPVCTMKDLWGKNTMLLSSCLW